jgi:hypothetical protein
LADPALVAQGIEHRPPEPGAQVRILPGAPALTRTNSLVRGYLFVPEETAVDRGLPLCGGGAGEETDGCPERPRRLIGRVAQQFHG